MHDDVLDQRLTRSERAVLISQIIKCYRKVNPDKVERGDVARLVRKYAGQELLLLRRIQHKYNLEIRRGRVRVLEGRLWSEVILILWADGRLTWSAENTDITRSVDIRNCAADEVESNETFALVITTTPLGATVVACADDASRRGWIEDLRSVRSFFDRMANEERAAAEARRDHALALEESVRTHRVEEDARLRAEEALRLDTARAAALSALGEAHVNKSRPSADESTPEFLLTTLEAAIDDALVHTARARDIDASNTNPRAAFYAFLDSVEAFIAAKEAVDALPSNRKPEPHVYTLIDDGTEECKQAASRILKSRDTIRRQDPDLPTHLDPVPAVPAEIGKIILDTDDL